MTTTVSGEGPPGARTSLPIDYHELRRGELPSHEAVILSGLGSLERAIGLDRTTTDMVRALRRPTFWVLYRLLRAIGRSIVIFVGVEGGRVVGTVSVIPLRSAGVVVGVATEPAARGRGIATQLIGHAHEFVRKKGTPWLALDVESDNEAAIRVYRRLGYSEQVRYAWYAGPTPGAPNLQQGETPSEVPRSRIGSVAAWVDSRRPEAIRNPYPASARRLSHHELLFRLPGSRARTWDLALTDGNRAVVRGVYSSINKVGYLVPAAWDPGVSSEALRSVVAPAIDWFRSEGSDRTVLVVPEPTGAWDAAVASLGLSRAVTSILMTRPSTP